jgi:hypothetical protein
LEPYIDAAASATIDCIGGAARGINISESEAHGVITQLHPIAAARHKLVANSVTRPSIPAMIVG